jgi:galactose-1-phosphate uridylyltransferase
VLSLAELPVEQVVAAVEVWRERMRAHAASACVQLIVNERREAGASLPHTHAQLYALDFVPAAIARERERAAPTRRARWARACSAISSPRRCAGASGSSRSTRRRC